MRIHIVLLKVAFIISCRGGVTVSIIKYGKR